MRREPLDAGRFFAPEQRSVATMLQAQATKFGVMAQALDLTGRRLLDVGCGLAQYADYVEARFDGVTYTGIDLSPAMIASARSRRPELPLSVGSEDDR